MGGEGYFTNNLPSTYGDKEDETGFDLGEEFDEKFTLIQKKRKDTLDLQKLDKEIETSETLNVREKNKLRGTIRFLLS